MKAILLLVAVFAAQALAARPPVGPEAAWREWQKKEYQHFRETLFDNPFALQDVAEIAKGETRFVSLRPNPKHPRWLKDRPAGPSAEFTFDGDSLRLTAPNETRANFLKEQWTAPNGLGIRASGIRSDRVRILIYFLKENRFKPALMPYFPFVAGAVVKAKLDRTKANPAAKTTTTLGDTRDYPVVGELQFSLNGKAQALLAYVPDAAKKPRELFIPFKDATNGEETYGAGRYVEAELAEGGGDEVTIDFNRAYHPYCLYSPHFNCPVVAGNRIDGAVKAGARVPPGMKH